jgi:hypothetical protein
MDFGGVDRRKTKGDATAVEVLGSRTAYAFLLAGLNIAQFVCASCFECKFNGSFV